MEEQILIGRMLAAYPDLSVFTREEKNAFEKWLEIKENQLFTEKVTDKEYRTRNLKFLYELAQDNERCWARVENDNKELLVSGRRTVGGSINWQRYIVAASILLMMFAVAVVWNKNKQKSPIAKTNTIDTTLEVPPGQYQAKLTLSDGSQVLLDTAISQELAYEGKTKVNNKNGLLTYTSYEDDNKAVAFNTLTTTRGQMYATVLADGSKIWLNSSSSIRFPVAFSEDIRRVELTGEAYFEIAASKGRKGKRRFIVSVNGMDVEVLGTRFNINSYGDEKSIATTLLEGKVKIKAGSNSVVLNPGDRAQVSVKTQEIKTLSNSDIDEAIAWRLGYFQFHNVDVYTVMRQLARWYDLEIVYRGYTLDERFTGKIPRNTPLTSVLKVLRKNRIHFIFEGRKLIITP